MEALSIIAAVSAGCFFGVGLMWIATRRSHQPFLHEKAHWQSEAEHFQQLWHEATITVASLQEKIAYLTQIEQQVHSLTQDNHQLRQEYAQLKATLGASEQMTASVNQQVKTLMEQLAERQVRWDQLQQEMASKEALIAQLKTAMGAERRASEEKIELLVQAKEKLGEQFRRVADEVLETRTKRLTEQQQFNLTTLLSPLKSRLDDFQKRVEQNHQEETRDRAMLAKQVEMLTQLNRQIGDEAKNLTQALKGDNKTQGTWGEIILERILEVAGLVRGREYDTQVSTTRIDEQGTLKTFRPDVILHMPGNRHLIIDAKVSLTAYERYANADTEEDRNLALRQHVESIRNHIRGLSTKDYRSLYEVNSVDFVIMFVATEPAFLTAVSHDHELYADGWSQHVMLAGPSTLMFALRMVDRLWQQEKQTNNAEKILKSAAALYDKFHGFYQDFETIGVSLGRAQASFDEAGKKLKEGRGNLYNRIESLASQKLVSPKKRLKQMNEEETAELMESVPPSEQISLSLTDASTGS